MANEQLLPEHRSQARVVLVDDDAELAQEVIQSLVIELREQTYIERTPLFLQQGKDVKRTP